MVLKPSLFQWCIRIPTLLLMALAGACAPAGTPAVPTPEEIPALEERVETSPDDVNALVRLGAGYHEAGRLAEAASLLERARVVDPDDGSAVLFLGLVYEDQDRLEDALGVYRSYLTMDAPGGMEDRIRARVELLRRRQLRVAVRQALERESALADTGPEENTVAVFPFLFSGDDESLRPLSRAMADMLSTDLAQTDRLAVLERVQVQVLLEEMALGQSGLVEPSTAARSGRILGAGRIVQGQILGDQARLRLEAAVVTAGEGAEPSTVAEEDAATSLFAMEKALAFSIYESMGVALTPAEREAVNRRFTENLQALLAYGRGLEASDAGRYQEAREHFQQAASLDPDFSRAEERAQEAEELAGAEQTSTTELAQAQVQAVQTAADVDLARQVEAMTQRAGVREPAQEALGSEGVSRTGTSVRLIFKRPGGEDR